MGTAMTAGQSAYFSKLQSALPSGFPVRVTSAGRTAAEQASAMLYKVQKYGASALDIYGDKALISKLLALPQDKAAWTSLIEREGMRLSRHLWGGALDLHTNTLSQAQRDQLVAAVTSTGGRALMEQDHLHVDLPATYTAASVIQTGVESSVKVWLWSAALGGVALLGLYAYKKFKRPSASSTALARTNPKRKKGRKGSHKGYRGKLRKNRSLQVQIEEVYWDITALAPAKSMLRLRADELMERAEIRGSTYGTLSQLREMRDLATRNRQRQA
jgi:hypothetical protein